MELAPLIVLSLIALTSVGGLVTAIVFLARTNHRMGNQLIANSDLQIKRIEVETAGPAQSRAAEAQEKAAALYQRQVDDWNAAHRPLPNDIPGA